MRISIQSHIVEMSVLSSRQMVSRHFAVRTTREPRFRGRCVTRAILEDSNVLAITQQVLYTRELHLKAEDFAVGQAYRSPASLSRCETPVWSSCCTFAVELSIL